MKPDLKIWFTAFWGTFDKFDNLFVYALSQKYNVQVTPDNPEITFTDNPYNRYQNSKMVYFSGEPFFDIAQCDYALTQFNVPDERYYRLPLYLLYAYDYYKHGLVDSFSSFFSKKIFLKEKTKFCTYISRGPGKESIRDRLYQKVSSYKKVDCPGSHHNNMGSIPGESGTIVGSIEKVKFISDYKFTFSVENSSVHNGCTGYTTEKIIEPFVAGSIPIYWGNENIDSDFNSGSFLNWHQYGSDDKLLERLIEIDNDDSLYSDYVNQPFINIENQNLFDIEYLVSILEEIIK